MPSLVAEIAAVIEKHMKAIGLIKTEEMSELTKRILAEKRVAFETRQNQSTPQSDSSYPANATLCKKCHIKSVIVMDGCKTCLSCGDSKCG